VGDGHGQRSRKKVFFFGRGGEGIEEKEEKEEKEKEEDIK